MPHRTLQLSNTKPTILVADLFPSATATVWSEYVMRLSLIKVEKHEASSFFQKLIHLL